MKQIETLISPLLESHFPEFYKEEGPRFVDFVKSYYEWMESQNQAIGAARDLFNIRDIDKTYDQFVTHFKEKYLKDYPLATQADIRLLNKHALEIYQTKGTAQSIKTAIRALYNEDADVYLPGNDLLKPSDGTWVKPKYLEVTVSDRNRAFIGKELLGTISGAKAFCEQTTKKRINGKYIDVLYLSNIRGDFTYGEKIVETANTTLEDAPTVSGSLTSLTVLNGGQGFSIGDELQVVSESGQRGKALVSAITTQTGRVNFSIDDGGYGYTTSANVFISNKVLRFSNNSTTSFQRSETAVQNVLSISFSSAVNSSYFAPNTIIVSSNGSVNARAGIISSSLTNATHGTIKVSAISGNVISTNVVFGADLVNLVFSTAANISLFAANATIEAVNATATANAFILSATTTNTTHGSLLLRPISGNLATTNTTLRVVTNPAIEATINAYTSNVSFTAVAASATAQDATGVVMGSNSSYVGLDNVNNTFFPNTIFSFIVGQTSLTNAYFDFVSTGTDATFLVGSLDDEEIVYLPSDRIGANNIGNIPFVNINLDLSPNNANSTGFGFVKFPGATINSTLLNALRYEQQTIGSISSLKSINPGTDYNIDPFVTVTEQSIAGFDKRDIVINISSPTKAFTIGERVEQITNTAAVILTVSNFSGTYSNGAAANTFEVNEYVYQSNGTANIATGFVYTTAVSAGNGQVKLYNLTGTFEPTSTNGYQLISITSNAVSNIVTTNTATSVVTTGYGEIKTSSNNSTLFVKRLSFADSFTVGNTVLGVSSGATATVVDVQVDEQSLVIGDNAVISGNVQTANAVASAVTVLDSGFGYNDGEDVTLVKQGYEYVVTARTKLQKQGVGEGFYSSTRGFLSSDKHLIDGDYWQDYSYEIQTKIPFSLYADVLKQIVHVAGTKMFGKIILNSFADFGTSVTTQIDIT